MTVFVLCITITLICISQVVRAAVFNGPYDWTLSESEITPNNPYCFNYTPVNAVVDFNGAFTITPSSHCAGCFGIWYDAGESRYCIFFQASAINVLDYDLAKKYLIPVKATDGSATIGSATVTLQILKNTPPFFTSPTQSATITISVNQAVGSNVYSLPVDDLQEGTINLTYDMEINAQSDRFVINAGNVIVKTDLNYLCVDSVELVIRMSDGFNPVIGPYRLTVVIDWGGKNYKPVITTKDFSKNVKENVGGDYFYFRGDTKVGGSCAVSANPPIMFTSYTFVCGVNVPYMNQVGTANYEADIPVNYTIIYNDGFCDADPFWVYINWTDEPETPSLSATPLTYTVEEGIFRKQPQFIITDDDTTETHKYLISSDPSGEFGIVEATGELYTKKFYSLTNVASEVVNVQVIVTDSRGLQTNVIQFDITFTDINDNRPVIDPFKNVYIFTDCTAGMLLATLTAQDKDFGANAAIDFIAATSQSMRLEANGQLFLKAAPIAGNVDKILIRAKDRGTPAQTSLDASASVVGVSCGVSVATGPMSVPVTTTPGSPATNTGPSASNPGSSATNPGSSASNPGPSATNPGPSVTTLRSSATNTPTNSAVIASIFDSPWNIAMIIIGAILLLLIALLITYFIMKYCCNRSHKTSVMRSSTKNNTVKPTTPPFNQTKNNLSITPPKSTIIDDTSKNAITADTPKSTFNGNVESGNFQQGTDVYRFTNLNRNKYIPSGSF